MNRKLLLITLLAVGCVTVEERPVEFEAPSRSGLVAPPTERGTPAVRNPPAAGPGGLAPRSPEFVQGVQQELAGRWEQARSIYAAAGQKQPGDVDTVIAQSRTLLAEDRAADAATLLQSASARNPSSGALLKALGDAVLAAGGLRAALPYYQRAYAQSPEDDSTRYLLALASFEARRHGEVVAVLGDGPMDGLPVALQLVLGRSALLVNEAPRAAAALQTYTGRRPGDIDARIDLARALILMDANSQANEVLQGVLEDRPRSAEVYVLVGHVGMRVGQPDIALQWYEQAIALGADSTELGLLMARLRQRTGAPR